MLKFITQIIRIFTGILFIFSGFVKLVDPLGSTYKLEEYFGADVLNLEFLIPYALPFAILLILGELFLGIAILLGYKTKTTLWSLLSITTLFLFLTWYSAFYDKVTDCGCFGDAITLSSWATFYKNIVFTIFIVWMIVFQKNIKPLFKRSTNTWILSILLCISAYTAYYAISYLPLIDFRAYAVGNNIKEGMKYTEDGELPAVHDFYLESDTDDLTEHILNSSKVLLIVTNNLEDTDENSWKKTIAHAKEAEEEGYLVYAISSSSSSLVKNTIDTYQIPFEILFCDGTTLKTMCRANPGIIILENATITAKYSWKNTATNSL